MKLLLTASLLRRGAQLERVSDGISLLALGYALTPLLGLKLTLGASLLCAVLVLLGLVHKYWAVRVALDAELFASLAARHATLIEATQALDQALADLRLKPPGPVPRSWDSRCQGALSLLRRQTLCFALQTVLLLATLLTLPFIG
ncbi:hypothetical protein [Pseudomonas cremoricolorata]|uniref:Transmembrane protein n=1 Tax=Pseudomonas cremoricolorata TaxID=157783 RepID=A0A089YC44_9PSED|nr:hypothetical protein [Pseudomonas cremoricolorata]AIR89378.1 hypothetical protein LK03_08860 [Pseudomonas cremoricolorata]